MKTKQLFIAIHKEDNCEDFYGELADMENQVEKFERIVRYATGWYGGGVHTYADAQSMIDAFNEHEIYPAEFQLFVVDLPEDWYIRWFKYGKHCFDR